MIQEINKTEHQDLALIVRAIGTDLEVYASTLNSLCKRRYAFPLLESGAFYPLPPKERWLGKQSH